MRSLFDKKDKWKNFGGNINIYADLKKSDISKLAAEKDIHSIQFYEFKTPNKNTWETLNSFFKKYPKIGLTIFWYDETNWDFLELIPSVKDLSLKSYLTKDFSPITKYVDLEQLHLGETKSIAVDVSFINEFQNLKVLSIDGMKKGVHTAEHLKKLWSLNLRGVKLKNLDFISNLENLRLLKLMFGSYEDLSSLNKLTKLEYLGISRTRKIDNYEFLSGLKNLKYLHFEGMSRMEKVPDLSGLSSLKKIQIENLSKLIDILTVSEVKTLEEFFLSFPENFKASQRDLLIKQAIDISLELPNLRMSSVLHWEGYKKLNELIKKGVKKSSVSESLWNQNYQGGWTL